MIKATKAMPPLKFVYLVREHRSGKDSAFMRNYNLSSLHQLFTWRWIKMVELLAISELCRVRPGQLCEAHLEARYLVGGYWLELIERKSDKKIIELDTKRIAETKKLADIRDILTGAETPQSVRRKARLAKNPDLAASEHSQPHLKP